MILQGDLPFAEAAEIWHIPEFTPCNELFPFIIPEGSRDDVDSVQE